MTDGMVTTRSGRSTVAPKWAKRKHTCTKKKALELESLVAKVPTSTRKVSFRTKKGEDWTFFTALRGITLPPGEYYVGDLSYVLKDEHYDGVFGKRVAKKKDEYDSGFYYSGPKKFFFVDRTYEGDGTYDGERLAHGCEFGVDSGTIGIAPRAMCDPKLVKEHARLMNFFDFREEVGCFSDEAGFFQFGGVCGVTIDTKPLPPSDSEDDDEEAYF